jgi:hypothetical protein
MRSSQAMEAPPLASLPRAAPRQRRIAIPLHRVLGFARQESESHPSRQLAFALRPLLGLALATTGLCPDAPPALDAARRPGARQERLPPIYPQGAADLPDHPADSEILFSALSSLVEVVKTLTPSAGRVYAHLGHEAVASADGDTDEDLDEPRAQARAASGTAPRSEVVIELVSTAASAYASLPPAIRGELGGLAFELAVVAAIVESKGGELYVGSSGGDSRSFVVRLPVCRQGLAASRG